MSQVKESVKHISTRKELYDEIWSISAAGVARKYDIPYKQFLEQVKEADIPIPTSGYWAKLWSGKSVDVIELAGNPNEQIILSESETDSDQNRNKTHKDYNRTQLYKEVWERPIKDVAKKYHVSDKTIRKVCKSLGIPTPPIGYWSKVRSGTKVKRPPLPKGNYPNEISGKRNKELSFTEKVASKGKRIDILNDQEFKKVLTIADQIELTDHDERINPIVIRQQAIITNWQKAYAENLSEGLGKDGLGDPPMDADKLSEEGVARRSRIVDTLMRALSSGDLVTSSEESFFLIKGADVTYSFSEAKDKVPHVLSDKEKMEMLKYEEEKKRRPSAYKPKIRKYDYHFNGKLSLKLSNNKFFRDSKSTKIEDRLDEIVIAIYEAADFSRKKSIKEAEERLKKLEALQLQDEQRDRYNAEIDNTNFLLNEADDYEKSRRIRNLISAAEKSESKEKYSEEWITWAKAKADWFDPTVAKEDEIFGIRKHTKNVQDKKLKKKDDFWY